MKYKPTRQPYQHKYLRHQKNRTAVSRGAVWVFRAGNELPTWLQSDAMPNAGDSVGLKSEHIFAVALQASRIFRPPPECDTSHCSG
jgi:hypothetical protein